MDEAELLERVQRCRRLAKGIGDARTIKALHALADSYQRQADAKGTSRNRAQVRTSA